MDSFNPRFAPSRRTIVRAGVVSAWTAPAISLATAAPSMAASAPLTITGTSASYLNNPNPSLVNPYVLVTTAVVRNASSAPTSNLEAILQLPPDLFDQAPTVTSSPGFTTSRVTGRLTQGWSIALRPVAQIPAGASVPFDVTISLSTMSAGLYTSALAGRGAEFDLTATVLSNLPLASTVYPGPGNTPPSRLLMELEMEAEDIGDDHFAVRRADVLVAADKSQSRSGFGRVEALVSIPKGTGASKFAQEPTLLSVLEEADWTGGSPAHTSTHWRWICQTRQTAFPGSLGAGNRGPGYFNLVLKLNGGTAPTLGTFVTLTFSGHKLVPWTQSDWSN